MRDTLLHAPRLTIEVKQALRACAKKLDLPPSKAAAQLLKTHPMIIAELAILPKPTYRGARFRPRLISSTFSGARSCATMKTTEANS
jgi:hypothetical protein